MQGYKLSFETEYYRDVKAIIKELAAGRGTFVPADIAEKLWALQKGYSGQVTKSLMRALTQADLDGLVTRFGFITKRGGRGTAFEIHVPMRQMELSEAAQDFPF